MPSPPRARSQVDERRRSSASAEPSSAERRYTPSHSPDPRSHMTTSEKRSRTLAPSERGNGHHGVHWPDEPQHEHHPDERWREYERGRVYERHRPDDYSRSSTCSPRHSCDEGRRPSRAHASEDEKAWFRKKTLWAGVASLATVAALVPTTMAAQASVDSAAAAGAAARNSKRAAVASEKSAGWGSQVIGKKFNLKDLRAASDDLLNEFFGLDKHSRMSRLSSPRI